MKIINVEVQPGEVVVLTVNGTPYAAAAISSDRTYQDQRIVEFVGAGVSVKDPEADSWAGFTYPGSFAATSGVIVTEQTVEAVAAAYATARGIA